MKTCTAEGCAKPHRARGLCSTHYNQRLLPNRHAMVTMPCACCGALVTKQATAKYAARFCSLRCRDFWRYVQSGAALWCAVPDLHPSRSTRIPITHPVRRDELLTGQRCAVFITDCAVCQRTFATPYTSMTCSIPCAQAKRLADRREHKHRYRARKRDAYVAPVNRLRVYERDRWRCHLCGKAVHRARTAPHPMSPVLDHVIPLAQGGTHEPANVRTAHFICNALKRDGGGNEQLMLTG